MRRAAGPPDALPQSEKSQNREHDYYETDEINDIVHGVPFLLVDIVQSAMHTLSGPTLAPFVGLPRRNSKSASGACHDIDQNERACELAAARVWGHRS